MSITPDLRASARAAYRVLLRSASSTFAGDDTVLSAFRAKARAETRAGAAQPEPARYAAAVQHARDVAHVLRRNVVQAAQADDVWRLRITPHTELGTNDSIKHPGACAAPAPASDRRARRDEKQAAAAGAGSVESVETVPRNFAALKRAHRGRELPALREEDLEESFVRGSGPGGQSINKTQNNVQLLHRPTGLRVACQATRSLQLNRERARRILLDKLDKLENPGLSKGDLARAKQLERERQRRKKARKKQKAQAADDPESS